MRNEQGMVIVGASLAGARAAEALRAEGYGGPLVLIGAEDEIPYERPPLSKDYLMGKHGRDKIYVRPREWYSEHDVDLRLGTTVTAVEAAAHKIVLEGGDQLGYEKLLLATGSSPRRLRRPEGRRRRGSGRDGNPAEHRARDCRRPGGRQRHHHRRAAADVRSGYLRRRGCRERASPAARQAHQGRALGECQAPAGHGRKG